MMTKLHSLSISTIHDPKNLLNRLQPSLSFIRFMLTLKDKRTVPLELPQSTILIIITIPISSISLRNLAKRSSQHPQCISNGIIVPSSNHRPTTTDKADKIVLIVSDTQI